MVPDVHKKLRKAYENRSRETNIMQGARESRFEEVPDLSEYSDLWLTVQLFAAKRTEAAAQSEASAEGLR